MAIAVGGKAQIDTTEGGGTVGNFRGYYKGGGNKFLLFGYPQPVYDTVPVLLLYSDTARGFSIWGCQHWDTEAMIANRDTLNWTIKTLHRMDTSYYPPNPNTYWMKGFEVISSIYTPRTSLQWISFTDPEYLDEKRKPLSKNIVVWMSKRINSGGYFISD